MDQIRLACPEDMENIRAILSDPSVAPTFGAIPEDLEDFGIFVFPGGVFGAEVRKDWSVYVHVAVLPWARGRRTVAAMKTLVRWFFEETPCVRVAGWTPADNRAGHMFNRIVGARLRGEARGKKLFAVTRSEWERQVR